MSIGSLATERLFFNYVTNYRFSHDTIPIDYTFSDTDFMDFTNFLNDKEYKYKTETEKTLDNFKKEAKEEKYFNSLSEEYDALLKMMLVNKNDDLFNSKDDIKEILTGEIMSRYYYQKGRIMASLNFDQEVKKAIEILQNKEQYLQILKFE